MSRAFLHRKTRGVADAQRQHRGGWLARCGCARLAKNGCLNRAQQRNQTIIAMKLRLPDSPMDEEAHPPTFARHTMEPLARRHLRVMHACEKGATGVYWGHRAVARVFYRDMLAQLDEMHGHEMAHYAMFGQLMRARGVRTVIAPVFWCAGGIVYGVLTALGGRRAVWRSTAVIEAIVERELQDAAQFFEQRDAEIHSAIVKIVAEEVAHKAAGEANSPGSAPVDGLVEPAARAGALASKALAKRL